MTKSWQQNFNHFYFILIFIILVAGSAKASDYTVTSNADTGGTNTLRGAISAANAISGNTIHKITIDISDSSAFKLNSQLIIKAKILIIGQGVATTVIDGQNACRCFSIDYGAQLSCKNLSLINGYAGTSYDNHIGAAVYISGSAVFDTCHFNNNIAEYGGGAFQVNSSATLLLANCFIGGNITLDGYGGALDNYGTVTISYSTFISNHTNGSIGHGGAINNSSTGNISVSFSTFESNTSSVLSEGMGGAIYNQNSAANALDISYSTFKNNQAGSGGAICNDGWCNIQNSSFFNNQASGYDNDLGHGGGVFIGNQSDTIILNSTFSANQANASGGAIYDGSSLTGAEIKLSYVTITDNIADYDEILRPDSAASSGDTDIGGGICQQQAGIICINSLIAGNEDRHSGTLTPVPSPDFSGTLTSAGYNLIGIYDSENSTEIIGDTSGNQTGTLETPLDPVLGLLQNNGGLTYTHALLTGSPAIDAGSNVDVYGNTITWDQREILRPQLASSAMVNDIGAYEKSDEICTWPTVSAYTADGTMELLGHDSVNLVIDELLRTCSAGTFLIKARQGWINSSLRINEEGYTFIISGGYNCRKSVKDGTSFIRTIHSRPALEILAGCVVAEELILQH